MSYPKIKDYQFGRMVVGDQTFTNDLILFPDHIQSNWWRQEGHSLQMMDLEEVLEAKPEVLIIGQGAHGRMRVPRPTREVLESHGIQVIAEPSGEAWKTYNQRRGEGVVGAFHLTC